MNTERTYDQYSNTGRRASARAFQPVVLLPDPYNKITGPRTDPDNQAYLAHEWPRLLTEIPYYNPTADQYDILEKGSELIFVKRIKKNC